MIGRGEGGGGVFGIHKIRGISNRGGGGGGEGGEEGGGGGKK